MDVAPKLRKAHKCCVLNCPNYLNSPGVQLYRFPKNSPFFPEKVQQREAWIRAVRLKNCNGSEWVPSENTRICSAHFVGNKRSKDYQSPAYNPTIFPAIYKKVALNSQDVLARYERKLKRNRFLQAKENVKKKKIEVDLNESTDTFQSVNSNVNADNSIEDTNINHTMEAVHDIVHKVDCDVQVNFLSEDNVLSTELFICNMYKFPHTCEAETQASIPEALRKITFSA